MIKLYDAESGRELGTLTDEQFAFLQEQLEEESASDQDYYISVDTLEMIESEGGDGALLALLRSAMGARRELDVRWEHV